MNHARQMLEAHPRTVETDMDALTECIEACFECARTCSACADACERMLETLSAPAAV